MGEKLIIGLILLGIIFVGWVFFTGIWEADTQNDFEGNIEAIASGGCLKQYDCFGNLEVFTIGGVDILDASKTWDLFIVPVDGETEGLEQDWDKLINGASYVLYKKSFSHWGVKSAKSKSFGRADLTSYFIKAMECSK